MSNLIEKQFFKHVIQPFVDKFQEKLKEVDADGLEGPDLPQAQAHVAEVTEAIGDGLHGANMPEVLIGVKEVAGGVDRIKRNVDIEKIQAALVRANDHVIALAKLGYAIFLKYAPKK